MCITLTFWHGSQKSHENPQCKYIMLGFRIIYFTTVQYLDESVSVKKLNFHFPATE